MHPQTVNQFIEINKDCFFPNDKYDYGMIANRLMMAPDSVDLHLRNLKMSSPSTTFILSIFLGSIGVDRFYLGDIVGGILKYFTFGGLGIWWIIDIITAKKRCCTKNCEKLLKVIDSNANVNINANSGFGSDFNPGFNPDFNSDPDFATNINYNPSCAANPAPNLNANSPDLNNLVDKAKVWAPVGKEIIKGAKDIGKTFHMN